MRSGSGPHSSRCSGLITSPRFIFTTESYGGHYGPEFVTYFNEQNAKIQDGTIEGQLINVSALMINKCAPLLSPSLLPIIRLSQRVV